MASDQIVLDLETQKSFDEVGGRNFSQLGVSLVGIYSYATQKFEAFRETELAQLETRLSEASRIIGFNTNRFDFPVLQPYMKYLNLAKLPSLDLLQELETILGHRVSLNSVAQATLNVGKGGSGLDAIAYYRSGDFASLEKYCLQDVRITRDVYEFGKLNGQVLYQSKDKVYRLEAKVNWQDPKPPANLSLF